MKESASRDGRPPGQVSLGRTLWNFAVLIGGAGAGQVVALLMTPILTRLVGPSDMGVFGTYSTIVALLTLFASFGFETAIISARNHDAPCLVAVTVLLTIVASALVSGGLLILCLTNVVYGLAAWLALFVFLDTVLSNAFNAMQYYLVREHRYGQVSVGRFASYAARSVASTGVAFAIPTSTALIVGNFIGRTVALWTIDFHGFVVATSRDVLARPTRAYVVVRRYWKAAIFVMPSGVLEAALVWLPVILSSAIYGLVFAGYVALAQRVFGAALSLLARSAADVYQAHISAHGAKVTDKVIHATVLLLGAMMLISAPICALIFFWGGPLVALIFGAKWAPAGGVVAALAPMAACQLCGSILTRLLIEATRQELKLHAIVAFLACIFASFGAGYVLGWSGVSTLWVASSSSCAVFGLWFAASVLVCRMDWRRSISVAKGSA